MTVGAARAGGIDLGAPFELREDGEAVWIEVALPGATGVFSTRCGGRSEGPYESLNLGVLTDDDPARVSANRQALASALGRAPGAFAMGLQVHGNAVQCHTSTPEASAYAHGGLEMAKADGQLTTVAEVTPIVLVADCAPLVLTGRGAAGVVHCGWRGVAAGIVPAALEKLCSLAGCTASDVSAAIGPAIGRCCYRVGVEVLAVFEERGHQIAIDADRLDLPLAVQSELVRLGVPSERSYDAGICTSCNPGYFFSHRRDGGVTGRQAGLAWLG